MRDPIFDGEDSSSTGSLAVAPSDPNIVYVGTGEALYPQHHIGRKWCLLQLLLAQKVEKSFKSPEPKSKARIVHSIPVPMRDGLNLSTHIYDKCRITMRTRIVAENLHENWNSERGHVSTTIHYSPLAAERHHLSLKVP
jgi:hypothetical protein